MFYPSKMVTWVNIGMAAKAGNLTNALGEVK